MRRQGNMTAPKEKEKPHYLGHRQRLRERFLKAGAEGLADYELLEMLLFAARPRGDVKPLAKRLIQKFGSYAAVIKADPVALGKVDGAGESVIAVLKLARETAHLLLRDEVRERPVVSSWTALLDYCRVTMAHLKQEQFRILFLNKRNELIGDEVQQTGTVDHTPVYPREVVKRALDVGATALIMVHNHPSGDPTPSKADIEMTRQVDEAARALGVTVHDHLVIGEKGHYSFKSNGLL